jgi:hypothetical protein
VQDFGQVGAHALAQARRENDDVESHAPGSSSNSTLLTAELASAYARIALANVDREFPRALAHLLSAAHMHWLLVRCLRLYPMLPENGAILAALDARLSAENLALELEYLKKNPLFERPYGWAWLLELQAEALRAKSRWSRSLAPLAQHVSSRMAEFFGVPYPMRAGSHFNTAFAGVLALDYARTAADQALEFEIRKAAKRWYGSDRDAPIACEPSLDDFVSPSLVEAKLMKEVLEPAEFNRWLAAFLPNGIGRLAEPPTVADRSDARQAHLDGLCLTRAWCFSQLGFQEECKSLLAAALPHVAGDYAGSHWLAPFAALALGERP